MPAFPPVILWFRRDLRLADNPALHHALASASLCVIEQGCVPPGWEAAVDWAQKHPAQTA